MNCQSDDRHQHVDRKRDLSLQPVENSLYATKQRIHAASEGFRFCDHGTPGSRLTQAGLDWVEGNSMRSVLLRHFPDLEPALRGVENPFAPWVRAGSA